MDEMWKPVPGTPGYLISDRGRIYSIKYEKILKWKNGGLKLRVAKGQSRWFRRENLVKAAFGLGCDRQEDCQRADMCWKCGLNPEVEEERKAALKERGLTRLPDWKYGFVIKKSDWDKGWTNPWKDK